MLCLLGWHLCGTNLPRNVFNSKTKSETPKKKRPETSPINLKPCSSVASKFFTGRLSQFCTRNFKHNFKQNFKLYSQRESAGMARLWKPEGGMSLAFMFFTLSVLLQTRASVIRALPENPQSPPAIPSSSLTPCWPISEEFLVFSHCKNWDLDLSDEGFWDSLLGRVCNREPAVLRQTSSQDFFSEKGRSETDPLGRVISDSCLRNSEPRSRSQKMLSFSWLSQRSQFFISLKSTMTLQELEKRKSQNTWPSSKE